MAKLKNSKQEGDIYSGIVYRYYLDDESLEDNGKSYVGVTIDEKRRRENWNKPNGDYAGKKISNARKKYGLIAFKYQLLEQVTDTDNERLEKRLLELEIKYIAEYDSYDNGFNGNRGGNGLTGVKKSPESISKAVKTRMENGNYRQSEEAKKKIGEKSRGRKKSDEERKKISVANKDKKRTEEQKKAQSERQKGRDMTRQSEAAKKWREEVNGGIGYWGNHPLSDTARANMKKAQQERGIKTKAIRPDGTETIHDTMLDAARECNVGVGSVANCIKTGGKTRTGYRFECY